MARGRCDVEIISRSRVPGAELITRMRLDFSATVEIISDLAASIGMRATLAPLQTRDDDEGET